MPRLAEQFKLLNGKLLNRKLCTGLVGLSVGAAACTPRFTVPEQAPLHATDLNGIALPDVCINATEGPHHVFVIGDWGGVMLPNHTMPIPADHRSALFPQFAREFVFGVDDTAQMRVAEQMRVRAASSQPDYILNVGDNFYWGGILAHCGTPAYQQIDTGQWGPIFESVYTGDGIDGKQWLGVLGNHDYGGFMFISAWDQTIGYTWSGKQGPGRWMTPAQYWQAQVHYQNFSVDYYFIDSNVFDTFDPHERMGHNICGLMHNPEGATCGSQGPQSVSDCPAWFSRLWADQMKWLDAALAKSTADWQIIVTHFPPEFGQDDWKYLSAKHGIDLYIAGHKHMQEVHLAGPENVLNCTPYIISGGGGGITSELQPDPLGDDDAYGFMDITLSKDTIKIESISHSGKLRLSAEIGKVQPSPTEEVRYV